MKLEGRLIPPTETSSRYWAIEVPVIGLHTQGKNQRQALIMIKDAIFHLSKGIEVDLTLGENHIFWVGANDQKAFLAFILSRVRTEQKLKIREASQRVGSKSPNTFGRYEQGKAMPRLDTLESILKALNPKIQIVLKT